MRHSTIARSLHTIQRLTREQGFLPFRNYRLPDFGLQTFMVKLDVNLCRSQKSDRDWMNKKTVCNIGYKA
jgi:hypothetical protein